MKAEIFVRETKDEEILKLFTFRKQEFDRSFTRNNSYFWLSDRVYGSFIVVEKIDNAIEVFPIVNDKMVPVSEGYWLENFYGTHFSSKNNIMKIMPTHVVNSDNTFLLKRIRGNQTMTMHYGHFLLDELTFLRCFLSLNDSKLLFLGNYDDLWQKSLLSFFFPLNLSDITQSHYHTSFFEQEGTTEHKPAGIISRVTLVNAHYRIVRAALETCPAKSIGILANNFTKKYRDNFSFLCSSRQDQDSSKKILLLERQHGSRFPKRWLNAGEFIEKLANHLNMHCDIITPEDWDPLSLAVYLQRYQFIFSEPGSAILFPLLLRNKRQRFFMPHCLDTSNEEWPEMLVDFKIFNDSLYVFNASPHCGTKYGDWSTQFLTNKKHLANLAHLITTLHNNQA